MISRRAAAWAMAFAAMGLALVAGAADIEVRGAEGHVRAPVWSADGALAFEVAGEGRVEVHVALPSPGGSVFTERMPIPGRHGMTAGGPVWHHEGHVVFWAHREGEARLYAGLPRARGMPGLVGAVMDVPGEHRDPALSADGRTLVFSAGGDLWRYEIGEDGAAWRLRSQEGSVGPLTRSEAEDRQAALSADGTRLAFTRGGSDIWWIDLGTEEAAPLAATEATESHPAWAGEAVVHLRRAEGGHELVLAAPDREPVVLARGVQAPTHRPGVSPDGRWVAWASAERPDHVAITAVEGGATTWVQTPHQQVADPALGLREGRLVLAYTHQPADGRWRRLATMDLPDSLR